MNDLTNHGVPRAFQLLWRRRPRVAAASWCKRIYGREREWRSRVGLTECGKCGSGTSVDRYGLPANFWWQLGPSNAPQCLPPNYQSSSDFYYSPGVCPSGYTEACTSSVINYRQPDRNEGDVLPKVIHIYPISTCVAIRSNALHCLPKP